jgi:hypothetical protein
MSMNIKVKFKLSNIWLFLNFLILIFFNFFFIY